MDSVAFFLWIGLSIALGIAGSKRKIGFWPAFLLSLVFSPLIGAIVTLTSKTLHSEQVLAEQKRQTDAIMGMNSGPRQTLAIALKELDELRQSGAIGEDEYQAARKNILGI